MEIYKLIKKYPSLPSDWETGMKVGINGTCLPESFSPCDNKYKDYYVPYAEVTENPTYWGKVVEKGYEILSVKQPHVNFIYKLIKNRQFGLFYNGDVYYHYGSEIRGFDMIDNIKDRGWEIMSIRRTSDDEIFAVGDWVTNPAGLSFVISKFYFDSEGKKLLCNGEKTGNGHISIEKIRKTKEPLFVTEDGVDILEHCLLYCVNTLNWSVEQVHSDSAYYYDNKINCVLFESKENAKEFVLMNKPLNISIKELCLIISSCNNTTYIDLDLLTEKLKKHNG